PPARGPAANELWRDFDISRGPSPPATGTAEEKERGFESRAEQTPAPGRARLRVRVGRHLHAVGVVISPFDKLKWLRTGLRPPVVLCPNCRQEMAPKEHMPVLFTNRLIDIIYVCERCGTAARRTVR